jgi:hypothetical protein
MRSLHCIALLAVAVTLAPSSATAQRTAPIIKTTDSTYKVVVEQDTLYAITKSMMQLSMNTDRQLTTAQTRIATLETSLARFEDFRRAAERAMADDSAVIKTQRDQINDQKLLLAALEKKLRRAQPFISVEAGAGFNKNGLGAIGGIGIRRMRFFGTLQEEGSGLFAGLFLPVF